MSHIPVLLDECIDFLDIKPNGVYIDATMGRGGHTRAILERLTGGRVICFDQDPQASVGTDDPRVTVHHANFREMLSLCDSGADGVLFDLGVSSPQLDEAERGFSYHKDAKLDMRMNTNQTLDAHIVVNGYSKDQLEWIIREWGEERYAERIAYHIVKNRERKPIDSTSELVEIIKKALPSKALREPQHPAMRTFQAIRIAVNDEMGALEEGLNAAIGLLNPGGRIAVISFHSLEDRLVKTTFQRYSTGCTCPPDFPKCICGFKPALEIITRRPVTANDSDPNRRARSAKLRAAEKIN
ncbi:MAG: 16S rRNA (cytosine(1402)-N(4))-methyltransferase RsmH [Oscillospiraceae bacterium]|nr:16S rRNA (cytosine(1402)-N(4))-methyltransferase RsmH [Oscillospiraceae bacterium]